MLYLRVVLRALLALILSDFGRELVDVCVIPEGAGPQHKDLVEDMDVWETIGKAAAQF